MYPYFNWKITLGFINSVVGLPFLLTQSVCFSVCVCHSTVKTEPLLLSESQDLPITNAHTHAHSHTLMKSFPKSTTNRLPCIDLHNPAHLETSSWCLTGQSSHANKHLTESVCYSEMGQRWSHGQWPWFAVAGSSSSVVLTCPCLIFAPSEWVSCFGLVDFLSSTLLNRVSLRWASVMMSLVSFLSDLIVALVTPHLRLLFSLTCELIHLVLWCCFLVSLRS